MKKVICSVSFTAFSTTRPYVPMDRSYGYGSFPFRIDACKPGEYKLLEIPDFLAREYVGNGNYMDVPRYADDQGDSHSGVARDIAGQWSQHVLGPGGDIGPGIGVIEGSTPTDTELRVLLDRQLRYCEWTMIEAEDKWIKGRRGEITNEFREAALWYLAQCELDGAAIRPAFQNLQWVSVRPGDRVTYSECWQCLAKYDSRAATCPAGHIVDPAKHFQNMQRQAEIDRMLEEMKQKFGPPVAQGPVPDPDDEDSPDPDEGDDATPGPTGQIKRHTCVDCGAEFDRRKQLVKHRLNSCAAKKVIVPAAEETVPVTVTA